MKFENLECWKRSSRLSADIYKELATLKDYGFKDQITRSRLSIPSNIAEGYERHLPDNTSIEDVQYHLYVLEKMRNGRDDIRSGRHFTTKEAKERLSRWLKP